mmetsp:Transcript_96223/g.258733  ORF Transcript_96223/g.258733 Transcript_96223/m.258733 type:complete len:210 (+) Transcript_96223:257-886(+)
MFGSVSVPKSTASRLRNAGVDHGSNCDLSNVASLSPAWWCPVEGSGVVCGQPHNTWQSPGKRAASASANLALVNFWLKRTSRHRRRVSAESAAVGKEVSNWRKWLVIKFNSRSSRSAPTACGNTFSRLRLKSKAVSAVNDAISAGTSTRQFLLRSNLVSHDRSKTASGIDQRSKEVRCNSSPVSANVASSRRSFSATRSGSSRWSEGCA